VRFKCATVVPMTFELKDGKIFMRLSHGELEEQIPGSWVGDNHTPVDVGYRRLAGDSNHFDILRSVCVLLGNLALTINLHSSFVHSTMSCNRTMGTCSHGAELCSQHG
jgi:hypothetical protein